MKGWHPLLRILALVTTESLASEARASSRVVHSVEVLSCAKDAQAYLVRKLSFFVNAEDQGGCRYPKVSPAAPTLVRPLHAPIESLHPDGLELLLCSNDTPCRSFVLHEIPGETDDPNVESNLTYRNIDLARCTTPEASEKRLAKAASEITKAGMSLKVYKAPRALKKVGESYLLPRHVMRTFDIDAEAGLVPSRRDLEKNAGAADDFLTRVIAEKIGQGVVHVFSPPWRHLDAAGVRYFVDPVHNAEHTMLFFYAFHETSDGPGLPIALPIPAVAARLLYARGQNAFKAKQYAAASRDLEAAVRHLPSFSEAQYLLARAHARLGRFSPAIAALVAAFRLDPKYRDAARFERDFTGLRNDSDYGSKFLDLLD